MIVNWMNQANRMNMVNMPFRKLGNRKKAEICNIVRWNAHTKLMAKSDNERFPMDLSQSTHVSDVVSVESDNDD